MAAANTSHSFRREFQTCGCSASGHHSDWLKVCQMGSFLKLLVTTGSIQDPLSYLLAVLDQGPGYTESFMSMVLLALFYQAIFDSKETLRLNYH